MPSSNLYISQIDLSPLLVWHIAFVLTFGIVGSLATRFFGKKWNQKILSDWAGVGSAMFVALALLACVFVEGFADRQRHELGLHAISPIFAGVKLILRKMEKLLKKN